MGFFDRGVYELMLRSAIPRRRFSHRTGQAGQMDRNKIRLDDAIRFGAHAIVGAETII